MSTAPVITHQPLPSWRLLCADALAGLATLPDASVHCVVTSPPYYRVRDYGTGRWEGGDEACDHRKPSRAGDSATSTLQSNKKSPGLSAGTEAIIGHRQEPYLDTCGKCGARRVDGQIGLEDTPAAFIARLVAVFAEVRRVLHPSGVLWVNMGDSYASKPGGPQGQTGQRADRAFTAAAQGSGPVDSLPAKSLIGMPWRLAFALQSDGWILRAECIWSKLNPMPESVTDRPTRAHEQVFLFSKQARYFYDGEAVREEAEYGFSLGKGDRWRGVGDAARNPQRGGYSVQPGLGGTRNLRTVWTFPSEPFSVRNLGNGYTPSWEGQDHYAAFPSRLAERCILAGSSQRGVCPQCGAPWRRVVEVTRAGHHVCPSDAGNWEARRKAQSRSLSDDPVGTSGLHSQYVTKQAHEKGWEATCSCNLPEDQCVPAVILDPFAGTGTTLLVALRHGRSAIGVDLSPAYIGLARARIIGDAAMNALTEAPPQEDQR